VLKKIKSSIEKISKSTGSVLEKFEAVEGGIKTISDQEEKIRASYGRTGRGKQTDS
jgi:methyl-accepting chemotaxis protein